MHRLCMHNYTNTYTYTASVWESVCVAYGLLGDLHVPTPTRNLGVLYLQSAAASAASAPTPSQSACSFAHPKMQCVCARRCSKEFQSSAWHRAFGANGIMFVHLVRSCACVHIEPCSKVCVCMCGSRMSQYCVHISIYIYIHKNTSTYCAALMIPYHSDRERESCGGSMRNVSYTHTIHITYIYISM